MQLPALATSGALLHDYLCYPPAVADNAKITFSAYARMLMAWDLLDPQPSLSSTDIHHCFDFEAVTIQAQRWQVPRPESIIAVAKIRVAGTEQTINEGDENPITKAACQRNVVTATGAGKARSLRVVCTCHESPDKAGYLRPI